MSTYKTPNGKTIELYNDGMEDAKDIAREMDLSEETIIQIIYSLRKSGQLD